MHAPLARQASNIFTGTLGPNAWPFTLVGRGSGWEQKADSTLRYSQAVPDPSTNRALSRLTSEVKRDPVHSTRCGRQRQERENRDRRANTRRLARTTRAKRTQRTARATRNNKSSSSSSRFTAKPTAIPNSWNLVGHFKCHRSHFGSRYTLGCASLQAFLFWARRNFE